jgi:hypothetical protein
MMMQRISYDAWAEHLALTHGQPSYRQWMGLSPGGAAAALGVTRQRIWQLVKEGKLDMILLGDTDNDKTSKVSSWLITDASIARLKLGKMSEQGDLLFGKPKTIKGRAIRALAQARAARRERSRS